MPHSPPLEMQAASKLSVRLSGRAEVLAGAHGARRCHQPAPPSLPPPPPTFSSSCMHLDEAVQESCDVAKGELAVHAQVEGHASKLTPWPLASALDVSGNMTSRVGAFAH